MTRGVRPRCALTVIGALVFLVATLCRPCAARAQCVALACDTSVPGVIGAAGQTDCFGFDAQEGEVVSITTLEDLRGGAFRAAWRVLDANGSPIDGDCGVFSDADANFLCGPLRSAGSPYRLEVGDTDLIGTGAYHVRLQRVSASRACEDIPLACDLTVDGQSANALDTSLFSFRVTQDEFVSITVLSDAPAGADFTPAWRLLDGAGNAIDDLCGLFEPSDPNFACGPLPAAGNPYRVEVGDGDANSAGRYRVRLRRLTAATACTGSVPLGCDTPLAGSIGDPLETSVFSFTVTDGEAIDITVVNDAPAGPNFSAAWRLLDGAGRPAEGLCGTFGPSPANFTCGPLPASGNPYRIEIGDSQAKDTGRFRVRVQRLTAGAVCEDVALECGVPLDGQIDDPLDTDLYSFRVAPDEIVGITVANGTPAGTGFDASWRLLDGGGSSVSGICGAFGPAPPNFNCGPLAEEGNPYRIEISDDAGANSGRYRLRVEHLTVGSTCGDTELPCGVSRTLAIDEPLSTQLFNFSVPDGTVVGVTVLTATQADPNFRAAWRLLDAAGNPLPDACGVFGPSAPDFRCGPLAAAGNPYRVEVGDAGADGTGAAQTSIHFTPGGCGGALVCAGDCDGNAAVTVDEVITGVRIALGEDPLGLCPRADADADGQVFIDEIILSVSNALVGCPAARAVVGY